MPQRKLILKHWIILIAIIVITRGVMFISFPIGSNLQGDDNQSAQLYLTNSLLYETYLIGNLRYTTAYAYITAPVMWFANQIPALNNQILLAFQVTLHSMVVFLVYDSFAIADKRPKGLFIAVLVAIDPFNLQWGHFYLPVYLASLCLVAGLWSFQRARFSKTPLKWYLVAGIAFGVATLCRYNVALTVAISSLSIFALVKFAWAKRLLYFSLVGIVSAGMLGAYILLIHYPSTSIWTLSCIRQSNLLGNIIESGIPLTQETGPATRQYLNYLGYDLPDSASVYGAEIYPQWRLAEVWLPEDIAVTYRDQNPVSPPDHVTVPLQVQLNYIFGPCAMDDLYGEVAGEGLRQAPAIWFANGLQNVFYGLIQSDSQSVVYDPQYLPRPEEISQETTGFLGFVRLNDGRFYTGELLWKPGISLYSTLFQLLQLLKWLTIPAIMYGLWKRKWFNVTAMLMLIVTIMVIAFMSRVEPRYLGVIAPVYMIVIGHMLADAIFYVRGIFDNQIRESQNSP